MIEFKDPIPPVIKLLKSAYADKYAVYGNSFPTTPKYPALLIRMVGGIGFFRLQIVARSDSDITAMKACIEAINLLEHNAARLDGLRGAWCEREVNPIHERDEESGKNEAWAYMRLEALEA